MKELIHIFVIGCFAVCAQAQTSITKIETAFNITKAKPVGTTEYIVYGSYNGALTGCSVSYNVTGAFIGRYDAASDCWQWVLPWQGQGIGISALDVDSSGNVFVAGSFSNTVTFPGNITKTSFGWGDIFVMKISASGTAAGVATDGTIQGDAAYGLTVDNGGNVYVSGVFNNDYANAKQVNGATTSSIYIAKFSSSLVKQWRNTYAGYASQNFLMETKGQGVSVDNNGNVFQAGIYCSSVSFSKTVKITLSSGNGEAGFIVKYSSSGTPQWARGTGKYSRAMNVSADSSGNAYMSGHFWNGTINFGNNITLTQSTIYNAGFLAKYNSGGTAQWAKKIAVANGGTSIDAMMVSANNNLFAICPANGVGNIVSIDGAPTAYSTTGSGNFAIVGYASAGGFHSVYMPVVTGGSTTNASFSGSASARGIERIAGGYMVYGIASGSSTSSTTMQLDNSAIINTNGTPVRFIATFTNPNFRIASSNENIEAGSLHVYPNPAKDILYISQSIGASIGLVQVYNATGRKVLEQNVADRHAQMDISSLASGMYYLKRERQSEGIRFVKE